jgi:hypothetical protein
LGNQTAFSFEVQRFKVQGSRFKVQGSGFNPAADKKTAGLIEKETVKKRFAFPTMCSFIREVQNISG